ncbi:Sugar transporter [Teratosphaeria destructans]|uniref:Sugar transporter n=1 Tax=Teratosphaeria destructans TaxID=418781 RepID=A0A9W7SI33_9PEZI|nr:Sugar transporter [Teratosphaeria destructans]
MERFSHIGPHFSTFSISAADRAALARTPTRTKSIDLENPLYTTEKALFGHHKRHGSVVVSSASTDIALSKPAQSATVPVFKPGIRFYLAFSALAALSLVVALDGTSISVALPVIAKALDGSATGAFWAGTAFMLGSTVFLPIFATFSNIFGRKHITLFAIGLFFAGCVVAGAAQNMAMMLVGRAIQGVGGGGITAMTNVLLTDLVPLRYRGNWIGILGAMWAVGSVSGPVIGGALSHKSTWEWIFYLNLPFILTSFVLVVFFIVLRAVPTSFAEKVRRADWIGAILFVASITSMLVPLTWGGLTYAWDSWRTITPLGYGFVGLIILAYHERFIAMEPIIRAAVFGNRTANIAYLATALHGMVLWCLLYYQPLYFEGVRGFSPILAGVALFPATFTVAPMAILSGILISKFGRYRWAIWGGWITTTLGVGFMCAIDTDTQLVQIVLTDLCAGVGLGSLFPALQFQLQSASPASYLANAVAMFCFSRGLGQTLGIAIGGNIFQNSLKQKLSEQPLFASRAAELATDATALVAWMKDAEPGDARTIMRAAYTDSLRLVYIVMACFACGAAVLSMFVEHYDLDRALETEQCLVEGAERFEIES